jgi:hypothetical protein
MSGLWSNFETKWQEHEIDEVMRYFVDGFKLPEDRRIVNSEWFIDQVKGKVVFRFGVVDKKTKGEQ